MYDGWLPDGETVNAEAFIHNHPYDGTDIGQSEFSQQDEQLVTKAQTEKRYIDYYLQNQGGILLRRPPGPWVGPLAFW